jgi:hypothetical protein
MVYCTDDDIDGIPMDVAPPLTTATSSKPKSSKSGNNEKQWKKGYESNSNEDEGPGRIDFL